MGLAEYKRKRRFQQTPEPAGKLKKTRGNSFVIQKHRATRLHYDLRLEMEGVLRSWAIPKGPTFNPSEKRLAVETEDHPIDYGDFEGVILPGNYGAGNVIIWESGTYEMVDPETPEKGWRKGGLHFTLAGQAPLPESPQPMLATLLDQPFDDDKWIFELKLGGVRALVVKNGSNVEMWARNGKSMTKRIPEIATIERVVRKRKPDAVYVDFLQNVRGKTVASVYSPRARRGAPVSTPLKWEEFKKPIDPRKFTIESIFKRIDKYGDLFEPALSDRQDISGFLRTLKA